MDTSIEHLHAVNQQVEQMGWAMARAFLHEPNFTYMLPAEGDRERALAWFFGAFVARLGLRYGGVYVAPGGAGGAVWMRPGAGTSFWGTLRAGLLAMPFRFGLGPTRRSAAFGAYIEQVRKVAAPPLHWYLVALGVAPEQQRRGIGAALLRPVLQRADADRMSCYLETFRARTVEFYERFGFSVVRQDAIPNGGPSFWCMARTPRSA